MNQDLKAICKDIRLDTIRCIGHLGVGHIGGCLSIVEVLGVLYFDAMHIDPNDPQMAGRDRLVCSKGHAGPAVYAALANRGYFDKSELLTLNLGGTHLPSHCDMHLTPGVDMTAGSLGQGLSCAVGIALGSRLEDDGATVYAIVGDGESQEGQIWEAAMLAAARKLDNLIAFTDYNKMQIDDTVANVCDIAPLADKWRAFGWHVIEVENGNDPEAVKAAVDAAKANRGSGKPTQVILHTVKGCGVSFIEAAGVANHSMNLSPEQTEAALREVEGAC